MKGYGPIWILFVGWGVAFAIVTAGAVIWWLNGGAGAARFWLHGAP